jgi:hypothetical protein
MWECPQATKLIGSDYELPPMVVHGSSADP